MSETTGLTKEQTAALTGQAKVGGGWDFIVKVGADGSAMWRGQTIERDAWNAVKDYAESHQVTDLWSSVSEASRRYSTATGERRGGEPRREPVGQSHAHADVPGARVIGAAGVGELVGAGRAGEERRAGDRARAGPALLCLAVGAARHRRTCDRRRRGHAHRLAADRGGRRGAARARRRVHRREVPRPGGAGPGVGRRRGGIRGGGRRAQGSLCG